MSVKKVLFSLVILAFYSSLFAVSFDFEDVNVSKIPSGWLAQATHSKENLATWKVEKTEALYYSTNPNPHIYCSKG